MNHGRPQGLVPRLVHALLAVRVERIQCGGACTAAMPRGCVTVTANTSAELAWTAAFPAPLAGGATAAVTVSGVLDFTGFMDMTVTATNAKGDGATV